MGIAATPHKFLSASACQIPSGSEGKLNQSHAGEQSTDPPWGARYPHGERCCQLAVWWWPFRGAGSSCAWRGWTLAGDFCRSRTSQLCSATQATQCYLFLRFGVSEMKNSVCVCVHACVRRGCPQLSSIAHNLCPYPRCSPDSMNSHPLHSSPRSRCSWSPVCSFGNRLIPPHPSCNCGHVYASQNKVKRNSTPRSSFLNHLHNSDFSAVSQSPGKCSSWEGWKEWFSVNETTCLRRFPEQKELDVYKDRWWALSLARGFWAMLLWTLKCNLF